MITRTLAALVASLVTVASCGGGSGNTSEKVSAEAQTQPIVSSISFGSSESNVDRADAESAWSRVIERLEEGQYSQVFESQGSLFGLLNTIEPGQPVDGEPWLLMSWDGAQWVDQEGFGSGTCFESFDCSIEIVGDGEVSFPLVALYWCCPMDSGAYRKEPLVSVFVVRDGRVQGLLPSEEGQFWPLEITANYFEADSCVSGNYSYIEEYGYGDFYCYLARTTRYLVEDGAIVDRKITESRINDNPFEACIWSAGETCAQKMFVASTEDCTLESIVDNQLFPLEECQYGYWMYEFEENLFADGFALQVDGFYLPSEVETVKRAQKLAGLVADGRIGPSTWERFVDFSVCMDTIGVGGMPNDFVSCDYDLNADGLYGPGDIIPD